MKLMSNESHILKHSSYYDADQFVELTNGCRHHFSIVSLRANLFKNQADLYWRVIYDPLGFA